MQQNETLAKASKIKSRYKTNKMKNSTLFILLYLIINLNAIRAQQFVNPANQWYLSDCCYDQGETYCETHIYFFDEMVSIDSTDYYRLNTNNTTPVIGYGELYREDGGLVFMKYNDTTEEVLIYDFNLMVGEQLEIGFAGQPLIIEVLSIDSITLDSGEKRKRLEVASAANTGIKTFWIEGLGSELSLMDPSLMFTFDCWNTLNCYHKNDILEYQLGNCELTNTEDISHDEISISCYPNPVSDHLVVRSSEKIKVIEVLSLASQSVIKLPSQGLEPIDVSKLPDGVYFLKVTFVNNQTGLSKFLKN